MCRLLRVTVDLDSRRFMIEKGQHEKSSISEEEEAELEKLRDQLEPYGDFTVFKDLSPEEIEEVTKLKKRRAELENKSQEVKAVWIPVQAAEVNSVVLIIMPEWRPIYVENMPQGWIEKLLGQQLIIENPQILLGSKQPAPTSAPESKPKSEYVPDPNLSSRHNRVIETIQNLDPSYLDLLKIEERDEVIYIQPHNWLGEPWSRIDQALTRQFGESASWVSKGKGDKEVHWEVN